ncbi:MAG TPA: ABC transporter permease [Gemmatimonadota bacterium]|nr:ABC transporter permease [Gemmatimonadota bacterium]
MLILEILRVAFDSLRANKMRSFLTMLGIVIGVGAVITMVALGTGARAAVEEQIASLGSDVLTVRPGQGFFRGVRSGRAELTMEDAEAVLADAPLAARIAPEMDGTVQVEYGRTNANVRITGSNADWREVNHYELALGRFFTSQEDQGRRRMAVAGGAVPAVLGTTAEELVGRQIRILNVPFEVIGVLEEKGGQFGFFNPDEQIVVPIETARFRILGEERIDSFNVTITDPEAMSAAMGQIEAVLRREHRLRPGEENDFWIQDRREILGTQEEATQTFGFLLAGIATVSLLVGGIGIMNIMLVSVTERTREIGVRKALGATRRAILLQFMVEALALCVLGGLIGIGLGSATSVILSETANWNTDVSLRAVGLAVVFSLGVGLFFGIWPAHRAARLDPIVALRYE